MEIRKVLVIYKTHLDIGFTDLARNVIEGYKNNYIPGALKTAKDLRESGSSAQFKWTTGSWLIREYLETMPEDKVKEFEEAVGRGDICWHALPFTTHTELMTSALFEHGISISRKLDERFGKKTIAAKMTDVPGHTKAMIPLLEKNGIELLHIGVNEASAVPEVPEIFRWKADSGEEITVIYSGGYGGYTPIGDSGVALYFAHTYDNKGAQTAEDVEKIFAELHEMLPSAEIVAADLNDVALAAREIKDSLPVVTGEIGDSWIHGVGTDPGKISMFRALERVYENLPDGEDKQILGDGLIMIPEHTWGLDEKTFLKDETNFVRKDFEAHRKDANYKKFESAWEEQRSFLYDAVEKLSPTVREICKSAMAEAQREKTDVTGMRELLPGEKITLGDFTLSVDGTGAVSYLKSGEKLISDSEHKLFTPLYEQFTYEDYIRFHKRYHRIEDDWAWQDFTKIGMETAAKEDYSCGTCAKAYTDGEKAVINFAFDKKAVDYMGAPASAQAVIICEEGKLVYDFCWYDKPANRVAEAIWLGFKPLLKGLRIGKLGKKINPYDVVSRGNRNLHASDSGIYYDDLHVNTVDCPLVSPGIPHLCDYVNTIPDESEGVYFNLYNNTWGTNFPMWYDENARFRFEITA